MIKQLEMKIEYAANVMARTIRNGEDQTPLGYERWGKLVGLCIAYKIAMGLENRAHISLASEFLERAQVELGHIDAEGYAA